MPEPVLKYETRASGRIAVITLNRPESMNALSMELRAAYDDAYRRFVEDDDAWVAIITGAGRAFCAGADLKETALIRSGQAWTPPPGYNANAGATANPPHEYLNLWKPTIAAINGFCLAGGWRVAQSCDLRIASEDAELGIPEPRWNMGAAWVADLTRIIGIGHALELVILADQRISAQRAYEIGFVNKVVPPGQALNEALAWAERILYLAPRSMRNLIEILYRGSTMDAMAGRAFGRSLEQNLAGMEDSVEGPTAFAQKRKPNFKAR